MRIPTVVFAALVMTACGGNDRSEVRTDSAAGEVSTLPVLGTFVVTLDEWRVDLPMDSLPAGRYSFRIENSGTSPHGLEIQGNGSEWQTGDLRPGSSRELVVDLKPGAYEVYCPLEERRTGKHEHRGMKRTLVVRAG